MRLSLVPMFIAACAGPPRQEPRVVPQAAVERDRDGDRIPDVADRCPEAAEDRDGFEDAEGCPDLDNDGDNIADVDDRCPNDAETHNGNEDDDGCPDACRVYVVSPKDCVLGPLFFARGALTSKHNDMLVELTTYAMVKVPDDISLVTLTGYRDRTERRALSRERAERFKQQLVDGGVDADRLEVVDGGVATDTNEDKHRRVDMKIGKQRVSEQDSDDWQCTPMGPLYIRFTDEQRKGMCAPPRSP